MQKFIIISGPPASGKTTLSKNLAERFKYVLISRDDYKESLFSIFNEVGREWSKKIGFASYLIMYRALQSVLESGNSCIIESNFNPDFDDETFINLKQKYGFTAVQLICHADEAVLIKRFQERAESGERHADHGNEIDEDILAQFRRKQRPFTVAKDNFIEVDTTDFSEIDIEAIIKQLTS